jgi:anthranilate 1,2-dioxygenase small subunit
MQISDRDLYFRIERLYARYQRCIDDDELELWPNFFAEKSRYKIISSENYEQGLPLGIIDADSKSMLEDRVASIRRANIFEDHRYKHFVSAIEVTEIAGSIVSIIANYQVVRIDIRGNAILFSVGRYKDKISFDQDPPVFLEKLVIFDNQRVDTLLALPL